MNRDRQHIEIFFGKRTRCRNCKEPIKHAQETIVVKWFDNRRNEERFVRHCSRECADDFYYTCLSNKSGVYF
jgi:hypothetical protein